MKKQWPWQKRCIFHKESPEMTCDYDKERYLPVLRCSICTGEQVAGLKDRQTGKFREIMLIRNDRELHHFMKMYGIHEITREY
ncbi:MAG: aspartate dehydrogenase [Roseburia sp.]|nr:aspartate dehydrogenase [Roseburia sp.]